jgi:hypothetical protein
MCHHLSGLPSSVSFKQKIPNLDLTIYEKEDGIGGTWYVNRYPVREQRALNVNARVNATHLYDNRILPRV